MNAVGKAGHVGLLILLLAGFLARPPVADARVSVDDLLEEAGKRTIEEKYVAAAEALGRAAALAHKKEDPLTERRVAGCIQTLVRELRDGAGGGVQRRVSNLRDLNEDQRLVLATVLPALDTKRVAAFVSVRALARLLLFAATEHGDLEHVELAAEALVAHASARGCGQATEALARYARGMLARLNENTGAAADHFTAALDAARAEHWVDLAAHAGTELAWLRWAAEDPDGTKAALHQVAELFQGDVSAETGQAWVRAVQARMPQGQTEFARIVNEATGRLQPQAGDPEGQSVQSGHAKLTPLGRAFRKMGARKPLVHVKRADDQMEAKALYPPKQARVVTPTSRGKKLDLDGLHLVFRDRSVGLERMQTESYENYGRGPGKEPLLPSARTLDLLRADYPLAHGETWSVSRSGVVSIR